MGVYLISKCMYIRKSTIAYILIMNVELYALSVVGGSNVREMCLNSNLFGVHLAFRYIFGYLIKILVFNNHIHNKTIS